MAVLYFLLALVGAYLGDRVLDKFVPEIQQHLQTHVLEDSIIAVITAFVIFVLMRGELSKRKRVQDDLLQARAELEQRVDQRTAELSQANQALQKKMVQQAQTEDMLRQERQLLQAVVDNAPAGIVVLSGTDLRVRWANRGYLQFLDEPFRSSGIMGLPLQDFLPQAEESGLAQIFRQVARECRPFVTPEFEYSGFARGTTYWRWSLVPLAEDATCPDLLLSVTEITEQVAARKKVEELMLDAERRASVLEVRVQARTMELAEARVAQKLAALEERQRLARELHDSVSQALYGIALGTHAAREMYVRQSPQMQEALDYVLTQANAAVDEMRALIFELRPEALAEEGLVAALKKQTAAFRSRSGLATHVELPDDVLLSKDAEEALYRIAQEAMHNIYKHARAGNVELRLYHDGNGIALDVKDDGQGFDPAGPFPGHLGLHSMCERATLLGGTLDIASRPGQGTRVHAWLPAGKE
jgi:signal transduction histidine kinase